MNEKSVNAKGKTHLLTLLQPGSAGVPQHDALLQAVDVGILCTVLNNLARPAASWKVHTHTHTFYIFSTYLYKTNLLQRAIFKWYFREWPHLSLQKLMEFCWSYLAIAHKYTHTATDIHMHTKLYPCDCLLTQLTVFPSKLPQTQMEWAQLLEAQQRYHDAELQKWREIIKSSVVLLDQVQQRLCLLLFGVMGRLCVTEFTTEVGGGTMDKRRASVPVLPFIVWIITKHTVVSSDPAHYKSSTSYFGNCSFDCLR